MTNAERKIRLEGAWKRYEAEAEEAKAAGMKAKAEGRKSDYWFWKNIFDTAREREMFFFNEYMNCKVEG